MWEKKRKEGKGSRRGGKRDEAEGKFAYLSKSVVDLMRSSVVEILSPEERVKKKKSALEFRRTNESKKRRDSLQPNLGSSSVLGQPRRLVQLTRPVHVPEQPLVLLPERRVRQRTPMGLLQLDQTIHQRLGNVLSSKLSKPRRQQLPFLSLRDRHRNRLDLRLSCLRSKLIELLVRGFLLGDVRVDSSSRSDFFAVSFEGGRSFGISGRGGGSDDVDDTGSDDDS